MAKDFDIVVVGGGIAGLALAAALDGSEFSIALLERNTLPQQQPPTATAPDEFDPRVSSLTPASQSLLHRVGAWPLMESVSTSPYLHMHVWDAEGTGGIHFDAAEVQHPCLGHIVENRVTIWALQQLLKTSTNVAVLENCQVINLQPLHDEEPRRGQSTYSLELEDGSILGAGLVVAADGAQSSIRRFAGFNTREWDYQHVATVTTVATELSHQRTAWQRFLPEGPLAFLPLVDAAGGTHTSSIVWSAQPERAADIAAMDDAAFCDALGRAFEHRMGRVVSAAPRFSFPLRQRHATSYYKTGLVLVGDAAHSIHPLAGQGVNLGLMDVAVLAEELRRGAGLGLAPGAAAVLSRFQRRRLADNLAMMAVMDGFKRLFGQRELGIRWLRNSGMRQLNRLPAAKRLIMRRAMGL